MSNTDSFIEEVSDEVRKDQLFAMYKKYGWIALAVIILIVGGAAYVEWNKAKMANLAQARGDALSAALNIDEADARAAALGEIAQGNGSEAAIAGLHQVAVLIENDDEAGALAILEKLKSSNDPLYAQLATLKAIMMQGAAMDPDQRMLELDALAQPGKPFRNLALEQRGVALLDMGKKDEAIAEWISLLDEPSVSAGLRNRTQQIIVSLGGELPERASLLAGAQAAQ